ncbi:MAG: EAL domain-containing protein [Cyanobacteria bacterium J06554_6]
MPSHHSLSEPERQRLARLLSYDVLDTPPEPCYDDLVALAAYICETPTAVISLVEADRQWFKAKVGMAVDETPRSVSFCDHTIRRSDLLLIEDARQHPDFCDNPLVTGDPGIRFYAGAPLISPDGYALGSICVIDYQPRQLTPAQQTALLTLSRQVMAQLELSQRTTQLEAINSSLETRVQERTADLTQTLDRLQQTQVELSQQKERLRHAALHDRLTGLPNREFFIHQLTETLAAAQHSQQRYAVLFLDLDQFKTLNDSLGHSVGDQLLQQVATRIQALLGPHDMLARLGGDEFVLLLDHLAEYDDAARLAERIQAQLNQPLQVGRHEIFTGASIGITFSHFGYRQPDHALRDADIAMYQAKRAGKCCYAVFDEAMQRRVQTQLSLENDLRRALRQHEFFLVYQPIFDLKALQVSGFEALIRWQHPSQGVLSPDSFIPIAEETGLIHRLGGWVISTACRQLKQWQQASGCARLTLNLNVSPLQLRQTELVQHLATTLAETALSAACIKLEITEQTFLEMHAETQQVLAHLKDMGLKLCIDDFGTGYSSLSRLHGLDIDMLKIDRAFIHELDSAVDLIKMILSLAGSLNMQVVAEGIETDAQRQRLLSLGCRYGQGFHLAPPLTIESVLPFLAAYQAG